MCLSLGRSKRDLTAWLRQHGCYPFHHTLPRRPQVVAPPYISHSSDNPQDKLS